MLINSQKGFSAIGLFLLGIVLLAIMNFAGIFRMPKSEVSDLSPYKADSNQQISGNSIMMSDVKVVKPTSPPPQPTIPQQPAPTIPQPTQGPTAIPTATPTPGPTTIPLPTKPIPTQPIPTATPDIG